jgi:drug/metabolite transporter (DMT)-like permease
MFKKIACIAIIITMFSFTPAFAQDEGQGMERVLRSTIYGAAIGAVAGLAFMLFTDNPEDHFDYIATGGGVGILGGLTYGLATSTGRIAIAEMEDGKVMFNIPAIKANMIEDNWSEVKEVVATIDLFNYRF